MEGSLEKLKKEQEEEREKQEEANREEELTLVCQLVDERGKMKTRIDETFQEIREVEAQLEATVASGDTDSCLHTYEDYVRCSEQLKKLEHEMKRLKDD